MPQEFCFWGLFSEEAEWRSLFRLSPNFVKTKRTNTRAISKSGEAIRAISVIRDSSNKKGKVSTFSHEST